MTDSEGRFRMLAEWERQERMWLSWPSAKQLWPGNLEKVQGQLIELVLLFADHGCIGINGVSPDHSLWKRNLSGLSSEKRGKIQFSGIENNDAWCRDHGPTFVFDEKRCSLIGVDWNFNAWGEKYLPWDKDRRLAQALLDQLDIQRIECPFIGEGGGLEVDGVGTLILTESVWANPNRNPEWKFEGILRWLKEHLGVAQIHTFKEGLIDDDTDGHVDMFARFVSDSAILLNSVRSVSHRQSRACAAIKEQAEGFRMISSGHYDLLNLPMPETVVDGSGNICPATYANYVIFNELIVVPQYGQEKSDAYALGVIQECFPSHQVVGFDSELFILEGGSIHCLTQNQPETANL
ncbi:MAG: agmatine deiminase family protein [Opitutales bacterium]|nr:agmatine deiminase family protein [Opitutales bacterium]